MATSTSTPLASSVEKTNGAKLSRLLIDGGTAVLRNVFDHYHAPANLVTDLNSHRKTLHSLLRRRILKKAAMGHTVPTAWGSSRLQII